ncbi:unnamed protein product [Dimorphilus gyrociliatus]|uniref:Uncharacterized protein n=1 Tax=Dimorphilus gyrociliatus TaxID=2664684 RepID=A0A7I8W5U6_9ANNE|nr:unnamed protein product [Dimorphilus gyrociliatus]
MASMRIATKHQNNIACIDFTLDNKIITCGDSGELGLLEKDGEVPKVFKICKTDLTSVRCSKKNDWNLYVSSGTKIFSMDLRKLDNPIATADSNNDEINQIVLNDDESLLGACDDAGHCRIFKTAEFCCYRNIKGHTNICATVGFLDDDILTAGYDFMIKRWNFSRRPKMLFSIDTRQLEPNESQQYVFNPPFIHSLCIGDIVAFGLESSSILLCNKKGKHLPIKGLLKNGHTVGVSSVQIVKENLVSAGNDGKVIQWSLNDIEEEKDNMELSTKNIVLYQGEKLNWMVPGVWDGKSVMATVDQTDKVTIIPLRQF